MDIKIQMHGQLLENVSSLGESAVNLAIDTQEQLNCYVLDTQRKLIPTVSLATCLGMVHYFPSLIVGPFSYMHVH